MQPKVYIAGPEVFLPNAKEHAAMQRELCHTYNCIPLHPADNSLHLENSNYETATQIYLGNIKQIKDCDIVIANCNPFRSPCVIDDGTAYELGFGNALGKISYGYITKLEPLAEKTKRHFSTIDPEGYLVFDDFTTSINLMMQCGMTETRGRLIEGNFEDCLRAIREDIDSGKLLF